MTGASEGNVYWLPLKARAEVAELTLQFSFERPSQLTFTAGQFMDVTFVDPPETDAEGNTRGFSINSAPGEPELIFTTRLRDTAFKRVLRDMPLGGTIKLEGPFGDFRLHSTATRPAVMIAGGIGVTPFRSMVRRAARERLPHRILLVYANRRPEDAPFLAEFNALALANARFTFVPVMTQLSDSKVRWTGEAGRLDFKFIERQVTNAAMATFGATSPIYYVAGPPNMVSGLRDVLKVGGINDDDIRTEELGGY